MSRHELIRVTPRHTRDAPSVLPEGYDWSAADGRYEAAELTMILSALGEETGLFALGDILVSSTWSDGTALPLPLQSDHHARSAAGYKLTDLAQKLVLVTPTMLVAWSGSYAVARALTSAIRNASKKASLIKVAAVVHDTGMSETELHQVSLIVHQLAGTQILIDCFNAEHGHIDGVRAAWQGSGAFDFLHDTIIDAGGQAATFQTTLRSLLLRAASTLMAEAMDGTPYDYLYGGWFELVISRTLGLRKIPYAIKFWSRRGQELGYDAPLFFNWYEGKSLLVCSLDRSDAGPRVRVVEIPDLLSSRRWRVVRTRPKFRPEFTFHVVLEEEGGRQIFVSDRHSAGHMDVEVGKRGSYTMKVQQPFIDSILGRHAVADFRVKRRSDLEM